MADYRSNRDHRVRLANVILVSSNCGRLLLATIEARPRWIRFDAVKAHIDIPVLIIVPYIATTACILL